MNTNTNSNAKEVLEEILTAYETRLAFVKSTVESTGKMLNTFRNRRETVSKELRELLAKSESLRKKDFDKMMDGILAVQHQREDNVKVMLERFKQEEEQVVERLKSVLEKGKAVRIRDLKRMLAKIKEEQQTRQQDTSVYVSGQMSAMQEETARMLDDLKKEREKMAQEWGQVVKTMEQKRAGLAVGGP